MAMSNVKWVIGAAMAVALVVPQSTFASATKNEHTIKTSTYYNVDEQGTNMVKGNSQNSKVTFQEVTVSQSSTNIIGSVEGKTRLPFQLTGTLTQAEDGKNMIVGHLKDEGGNFEVLHFSLDRSNSKDLMFDKNVSKKDETVLRLYLLEKNTRNVTVVELVNPDFLSVDDAFKNLSNFPLTDHSDEFWYGKLLKPVKTESVDLSNTGPQIYKSDKVMKDYVNSYNVAGSYIYEHFIVNHNISAPGSIGSDGQTFTAQMYVYDEYTLNSSGSKISSDTYTKIGAYSSSKLDTYLDLGDAYLNMFWDGGYSTSGSFDAILRWDMALPKTPLGFTVTYAGGQTVPNKSMKTFDNSGSYKYRQAGVEWDKGKYLQSVGQNFSASFTVGLFDASSYSSVKTWATRWTYDLSSTQNYTYGGTQTVPVYITYGN
ncbi:hypothetical protein [Tumebacillus flagellatus]|uniref:Uncharacterized protein n=1 Tax=Tumebacillus flagellatus TaxID=1157490 RepID=A0A074LMH3_9BACL|nr:hypothetical protein [Tumebacillus flagellatus]KEO83316.1 hypothetical protein EL26_10080 [Tumebacillus flagellatus]